MWWEIITTDSYRPNRPEDNTVILKANSMEEALKIFKESRGKFPVIGTAKQCRQIYYVLES